jgi:hypothetical protein
MRLVPTISSRLIRMSGVAFILHAVIRETVVRLDWRHSRPSLWFVGQISGVLVIVTVTGLVAAHREESRN